MSKHGKREKRKLRRKEEKGRYGIREKGKGGKEREMSKDGIEGKGKEGEERGGREWKGNKRSQVGSLKHGVGREGKGQRSSLELTRGRETVDGEEGLGEEDKRGVGGIMFICRRGSVRGTPPGTVWEGTGRQGREGRGGKEGKDGAARKGKDGTAGKGRAGQGKEKVDLLKIHAFQ